MKNIGFLISYPIVFRFILVPLYLNFYYQIPPIYSFFDLLPAIIILIITFLGIGFWLYSLSILLIKVVKFFVKITSNFSH